MYKVLAKHNGDYAVINTETAEVEALSQRDLLAVLYFGQTVEGVSFDSTGALIETFEIQELTDEDINNSEEDTEEEYDEDDIDLDLDDLEDYEENESEEEDSYEDTEDYEEDDLDDDLEMEEYEDDSYEDEESDEIYDIYSDMEEDDLELQEQSTVSKLYSRLSEEQVKLLKRYYLWYSQDLFINARKDPTLGYNDKNRLAIKKSQLNSLRNSGGQWYYAGFIDTGYDGGGYCTLGHKLRYMHVAWDVTVSDVETTFFGELFDKDIEALLDEDSCIIFGIKCISDFFEVDSDCTQALQKAQRDSLKDMEIMYDLYENGKVQEVVNSFTLMDTLVDSIKKRDKRGRIFGGDDFVPIFKKTGLAEFYDQFRQANMPVPKSLVQELRDNMVGWYNHKFTGRLRKPNYDKFDVTLERVFNKDYKLIQEISKSNEHLRSLIEATFLYESCGYYKYNADTNKDEGGASRGVKAELYYLYRMCGGGLTDEVEFNLDFIRKVARYYDELSNVVLQSDIEFIENNTSDTVSYDEYRCIRDKCYTLKNLGSCLRGTRYLYYMPRTTMQGVLDYVRKTDAELFEVERGIREKIAEQERKTQEEEDKKLEEQAPVEVEEALNYLRTADVSKVGKDFEFHLKVLDSYKKYGSASPKQTYYLKALYTELTGKEVGTGGKKKVSEDLENYPEYKEAIKYMLEQPEESSIKSICKSVQRYGRFSERQKKYLDEALGMYKASL